MSCTVSATSNALTIIDTIIQKSGSAAAAAYDINMVLNSSYANYSTQIVRVRRSGDNAEANYGVASNGYVDWSAITTWVNAGGGTQNGFVVTIYDQSGNARNMTQTDPAKQMQIIASGTLLTDTGVGSGAVARAAMRATGTQFYEVAASTAMFNFLHNGADGWITSVQRCGNISDPAVFYAIVGNFGGTGANTGFILGYADNSPNNNATYQAIWKGSSPQPATTLVNNVMNANQTAIINAQFDADNATLANRAINWVNNGSANANNALNGTPVTSNATANLQWGANGLGGSGIVGSLQRLVIWNANLSTQRTALTDLTNSYYGAYTPVIVSDPDAQAFVNSASITSQTQADAVNTLVIGMKAQGLWTKSKAIYPFVGGTAEQHKYNLKNPLDTNAAFRLVFSGSWTHSNTGALPNGTNAFASTFFNPDSLAYGSNTISYYSRTNNAGATAIEIGSIGIPTASKSIGLSVRRTTNNAWANSYNGVSGNDYAIGPVTSSSGYYIANRQSTTSNKIIRNGIVLATNTVNSNYSGNVNTTPITIGAVNDNLTPALFSNRECAFAHIGDGLSDGEATALTTLVTNFQTALGRQV